MKNKDTKTFSPITLANAVCLLIAGLVMGTIFTFGMNFWNGPVTREEAVPVTAVYAKHFGAYEDITEIKAITLRFADHEQLSIDGCCATEELVTRLGALEPGQEISALAHPNSDTILELIVDGEVLLDFDTAMEELTGEKIGFWYLGLMMYLMAVYGLVNVILIKVRG